MLYGLYGIFAAGSGKNIYLKTLRLYMVGTGIIPNSLKSDLKWTLLGALSKIVIT